MVSGYNGFDHSSNFNSWLGPELVPVSRMRILYEYAFLFGPMAFPPPQTSVASSDDATVLVDVPTTEIDNIMLAWIAIQASASVTVDPPPLWNLVRRESTDNLSLLVFSKLAALVEPLSYTWTLSSPIKWTAGIAVYPVIASIDADLGRTDTYSVRNMSTLPIVTLSNNSRVVAVTAQGSPPSWTPAAGWSLQNSRNSGPSIPDDIGSAFFDISRVPAGEEPAVTMTAAVGSTFLTVAQGAVPIDAESSNKPRNAAVALGLTETVIPESTTDMETPANSADLVIVLSEVSSGQVGTKLNTTATGVWCQEMFMAQVGRMECATSTNHLSANGELNLDFILSHPAGGGNLGLTQVYNLDASQFFDTISAPYATNLQLIANAPGLTGTALAAIEQGSTLLDASTLSSRRAFVGIPEDSSEWSPAVDDIMESGMDWCIRGPSAQALIMIAMGPTEIAASLADLAFPGFVAEAPTPQVEIPSLTIIDLELPAFLLEAPATTPDIIAAIADLALPGFIAEGPTPSLPPPPMAMIPDLQLPPFNILEISPILTLDPPLADITIDDPVAGITIGDP